MLYYKYGQYLLVVNTSKGLLVTLAIGTTLFLETIYMRLHFSIAYTIRYFAEKYKSIYWIIVVVWFEGKFVSYPKTLKWIYSMPKKYLRFSHFSNHKQHKFKTEFMLTRIILIHSLSRSISVSLVSLPYLEHGSPLK